MAQWLRALTALPEVLSSIPSNHMGPDSLLCCVWRQLQYIHIHKKIKISLKKKKKKKTQSATPFLFLGPYTLVTVLGNLCFFSPLFHSCSSLPVLMVTMQQWQLLSQTQSSLRMETRLLFLFPFLVLVYTKFLIRELQGWRTLKDYLIAHTLSPVTLCNRCPGMKRSFLFPSVILLTEHKITTGSFKYLSTHTSQNQGLSIFCTWKQTCFVVHWNCDWII